MLTEEAVSTKWFKELDRIYPFPTDYVSIDIESTGLDSVGDLIIQVGHCCVVGGKTITDKQYFDIVLDWTRSGFIDQKLLKERLAYLSRHMAASDKRMHLTYDNLKYGSDPVMVLRNYYNFLLKTQKDGIPIVAHNGLKFDVPVLSRNFIRFLPPEYNFSFLDAKIYDTGIIEKAYQNGLLPYVREPMVEFYRRVYDKFNNGKKWSLTNYCVGHYNLDKEFNLDMTKAHTAGFDAYITHLLFEKYRSFTQHA